MKLLPESDLLCKTPLGFEDDIPIFSNSDRYVANYQKIAADHIAAISPSSSNPFIADDLWKQLDESTRQLVRKYTKKGDRVLDVGVGLGRVLGPLRNLSRYGIDLSTDYLKMARAEGIKVALSKIEDMPFVDECFDMVLLTDVLEHVLDLNFCTKEILRVLRPGGVLVVRVPYKEDLSPYLADTLPYEFVHLRAFDENSLRLHFCKIFGMSFIEAGPIAPYLQGAARLKVRMLTAANIERLKTLAAEFAIHHQVISAIESCSEESLVAWIYELRDQNPDLYKQIEDILVLGMDINIVCRK